MENKGSGPLGRIKLELPEAVLTDYKVGNIEQTNHNRKTRFLGWLTFLVVAAYTLVAFLQWSSMREANRMTSRAIDAAREANALTIESVRARVVFRKGRFLDPVSAEKPIRVGLEIENVGRSEAIYGFYVGGHRWNSLPEGPIPLPNPTPTQLLETEDSLSLTLRPAEIPSQEFLDDMPNSFKPSQTQTEYFYGRVVYESLGRKHESDFCFSMLRRDKDDISEDITSDTKDPRYAFARCPKWNDSY